MYQVLQEEGRTKPQTLEKNLLLELAARCKRSVFRGDLLFGLEAWPKALPAWVSNYMKDVSAKTYLTKNTSLCVIRNPKPGRIF